MFAVDLQTGGERVWFKKLSRYRYGARDRTVSPLDMY